MQPKKLQFKTKFSLCLASSVFLFHLQIHMKEYILIHFALIFQTKLPVGDFFFLQNLSGTPKMLNAFTASKINLKAQNLQDL